MVVESSMASASLVTVEPLDHNKSESTEGHIAEHIKVGID